MSQFALRLLLAAFAVLVFTAPAFAAPETFKLDPSHTAVTFHINHFGFSNPSGKFMNIDGTLTLDQAAPVASALTVTIPVGMINTGVPLLDEHLKSDKFFDTTQFPNAVFTSTKIDVTGNDTGVVHGTLTMHGVTKPLDLNVKLNKVALNMQGKKTAGFSATASLKRSDYGMTTYIPNLGDDVTLDIETEANAVTP